MAKVLQIALWLTWSPRRCLKKLQPIPATGMFNLYTCYVACCLQGNTELAAPGVSASNSILAKVFLLCQQSSVCVLSIRDYRYTCKQLHMHPLYRSGKCCARQAHLRLWTTLMSFPFSLWAMLMMLSLSKHLGVLLCLISRCLLVVDCYEVRLQQAGDVSTANPECQTLHCFGL